MSPILFWIFTILMLAFGAGVIINRNPVTSALSLVVSFLCLAALFVGLNAYFIAVIQVLVYAGAVMVLFLFIIMLLDLRAEQRRKFNLLAIGGGTMVAAGFIIELSVVLSRFKLGQQPFPALRAGALDDVSQIGNTLFATNNLPFQATHNLPFQVVGALILVATIGVVILSKRELK